MPTLARTATVVKAAPIVVLALLVVVACGGRPSLSDLHADVAKVAKDAGLIDEQGTGVNDQAGSGDTSSSVQRSYLVAGGKQTVCTTVLTDLSGKHYTFTDAIGKSFDVSSDCSKSAVVLHSPDGTTVQLLPDHSDSRRVVLQASSDSS